jgi:DNA-binding response OmpR family regulator
MEGREVMPMSTQPTILIADDSPLCLKITASVLERQSWRVLTAKDGQEAVDKANAEHPEVIILDNRMPNLDGPGAARSLRKTEATRRVPILMLSAGEDVESLQAGLQSGVTDYLVKPVDFQQLVTWIQGHLSPARLAPASAA